jgi:DNA-binding CsgD family transcriptional regulator
MRYADDHPGKDLSHYTMTAIVQAALAVPGDPHALAGFCALAARLGFDGFSYLRIGCGTATPELLEHRTTAAASWVAQYAERGYHLVDPRVTRTLGRAVPIAWNGGHATGTHAEPFLADAHRYAIRSGVAMTLHDLRGARVVVCWDSSVGTVGATRGEHIRSQLATLALLAGVVHEAVTANGEAGRAQARELTTRERECLTLAARGLTSCDIANKLGITERTANFHIGNVLAKFGALNRGEAIARAVALNLVSLPH